MSDISKETTQKLVVAITERFKQELEGENTELLDRLVRLYNSKLARIAWKESQKWCKWTDEGPILMPNYTRIYYRKGDAEVLLQEFPPQTRLLRFAGSLLSNERSDEIGLGSLPSQSFSLGLPYTIFIFKFLAGRFQTVQCMFSDRPLKHLNEQPMKPYFTNVDSDLKVCLGKGFDYEKLQIGNITQQVAFVLDHFWQSTFSNEWYTHYRDYQKHFMANDVRLATLSAWQDATEVDPLFVVDDVQWIPYGNDNFGDLIVSNFEGVVGVNAQFHEAMFKEISDGLLDELKTTIAENVNAVASKLIAKLDIDKEIESLNT